mgnify:FL=1
MVCPEIEEKLIYVYNKKIIPLMGKYSKEGYKEKNGAVNFYTTPMTPEQFDEYYRLYADKHGYYGTGGAWIPNDPDAYHIFVNDHVRKTKLGKKEFNLKQAVDNLSAVQVEWRDRCGFIFINLCHTNRMVSSIERQRHAKNLIFPNSDDVKDTGNLAEDCNQLITIFNPCDERYNLTEHFGAKLANYPNYRSLHLVENRNGPSPRHIQTNMYPGINLFTPLKQQIK